MLYSTKGQGWKGEEGAMFGIAAALQISKKAFRQSNIGTLITP